MIGKTALWASSGKKSQAKLVTPVNFIALFRLMM
jgi:hypothetical protein